MILAFERASQTPFLAEPSRTKADGFVFSECEFLTMQSLKELFENVGLLIDAAGVATITLATLSASIR